MKLLRQFAIITAICCLSELLKIWIGLPIPASIYGVVLLLAALLTGVLRLSQIEKAADLLIEILPVLFIPPAVGLMNSWAEFAALLLPLLLLLSVGTVLVMGVSGRVTQALLKPRKGGRR